MLLNIFYKKTYMAKKKEKKNDNIVANAVETNVENTDSNVVVIAENSVIDVNDTIKIENLSLRDLLDYEKAATIICRRYENSIKLYDGTIRQSGPEYFRFNKHNNVESTDYPEDILYDELLDDVVDFIIDHIEEFEYPESIQDIINDYLDMEE
jgi:hypothetical protein